MYINIPLLPLRLLKIVQGGLSEGGKPILLSSYVLAALLEAGENVASDEVARAITCIQGIDPENSGAFDPYESAIKANALSLAKHQDTETVLNVLFSNAVNSSSGMYWDIPNSGKPYLPILIRNTYI